MSNIISILRRDHVRFLKILDSLERQVKSLARGGPVDQQYIQTILEYFNGYPRRSHYFQEEKLLNMLEERAPDLCPKINVVLRCHRTLNDRLNDLQEAFHLWRRNEAAGRAPFVTAAVRFVEFERGHFADEEGCLFPAALKVLSEKALVADDERPELPCAKLRTPDPALQHAAC